MRPPAPSGKPAASDSSRWAVTGLVVLTGMILGVNLVALKVGARYAHPVAVQGMGAAGAAVTMLLLARWMRAPVRIELRHLPAAAAVGTCIAILSPLGIIYGLERVDASIAAVALGTMPIITLLLGMVLLGERHSWHGSVGAACGFSGVAMVALATREGPTGGLAGILFVLGGACAWALGIVLMRRLANDCHPTTFVAWQTLLGAAVLLPAGWLIDRLAVEWTLSYVAAILYTGVFGKAMSFALQLRAVRLGSAGKTSTIAFLLPAFGMVAGVLLLRETVRPLQLSGAVVIFVGVGLVLRSHRPGTGVLPG